MWKKIKNINWKNELKYSVKVRGGNIIIHLAMIALMIYGSVMVGSATMGYAVNNSMVVLKTMLKQILFCVIGYVAMCQLSHKFHLSSLRKSKSGIYYIGMWLVLLSCRLFPATLGAHAWIRIPGIDVSIQPSEFAKIFVMCLIATYLGDVSKKNVSAKKLLMPPIVFLGLYIFTVLVIQDDFGSAMVMTIISGVCLLIPRHKSLRKFQLALRGIFWFLIAMIVFILSPVGNLAIQNAPILKQYQKARILNAVNPFLDRYGNGFQLVNGLIAFASGGFFGKGYGQSVRKYMEFPAANSDFILAILVEELGYFGFLLLMVLYGAVIFTLLYYALKIKSEKARMILCGTASYFLIHIVFNIGGVTGLVPLTGIPLLMISSGGSSTMACLCAVGISQAVIASYKSGEIK